MIDDKARDLSFAFRLLAKPGFYRYEGEPVGADFYGAGGVS